MNIIGFTMAVRCERAILIGRVANRVLRIATERVNVVLKLIPLKNGMIDDAPIMRIISCVPTNTNW